jgi:hypothetical protein
VAGARKGAAPGGAADGEAAGGVKKKRGKDKVKKGSKLSRAEAAAEEEAEQAAGFKANIDDPRFAELLSSHHFALDPTDPRCELPPCRVQCSLCMMGHKPTRGASGRRQAPSL